MGRELRGIKGRDAIKAFVRAGGKERPGKGQHKKINLRLDYEDGLTMAEDDINENWEIYREKFFKGDFPRGEK
jgi:hypothetical protein